MAEQISFDIEDAKAFLKLLQEFNETLQQEWLQVSSQWSNLQRSWRDDQYYKFEPLFEKLSANYDDAKLECEVYVSWLALQIEVANKHKFNLFKALEKPIAATQIGMSLLGINISSDPKNPAGVTQQSSSSYVQRKDPNSCSLDDKLDSENLPSVQQYNSMPGVARVMSTEDQLNEVYQQEQEKEVKRRKKEAEDTARANQQPQATGSPNPEPLVNT